MAGTYVREALQAPFSTEPLGVQSPLAADDGDALAAGDAGVEDAELDAEAEGDADGEGDAAGEVPGSGLEDGAGPGQSVKSPLVTWSVGGWCEMPSEVTGVVSTSCASESS